MRVSLKLWILLLSAALALPWLLSCATTSFDTLSQLRHRYDLELPVASDYPNDDAVVILSTTDNELYRHRADQLWTERTAHKLIRVFRNTDRFRTVQIPIYHGEKVVAIKAQYIDPSGDPVPLKRAAIRYDDDWNQDVAKTGAGSSKHGDSSGGNPLGDTKRSISIRYPDVRPGTTIEFEYTIRRPSPFWFDEWAVQGYEPILFNQYTLTVPRGLVDDEGVPWDWRFRAFRCARVRNPEMLQNRNPALGLTTTYRWKLRDIAAFTPEPLMPPHSEYLEYVRVARSSWQNWNAVTDWYHQRFLADVMEQTGNAQAQAHILAANSSSDRAKVEELRRYVQRMETWDRPLEQGTLEPATPDQTLDREAGDSRDKSLLLVAMLRAEGIEAHPALIVSADRGALDEKFPSWQFDRMITLVELDETPIWIDPTAVGSPLGQLPWISEGRRAVVIEQDGKSRILDTPRKELRQNATDYDVDITFDPDGRARVAVVVHHRGERAMLRRNQLDEGYGELLARRYFSDAEVTSTSTTSPEGDEGSFRIEVEFLTGELIIPGKPWASLRAVPFDFDSGISLMAEESRKYPIEWGYLLGITRDVRIDLSASPYHFSIVPSGAEFENHDLFFDSRFTLNSSELLVSRQKLELRTPRLKTRNYPMAKKIMAAIKAGQGDSYQLRLD